MQTHKLKLDTSYFDAVASKAKPFEVRRDDRGFQRGDTIIFSRYGSEEDGAIQSIGYMDRFGRVVSSYGHNEKVEKLICTIGYILTGGQHGIEPGFVVLALEYED